MYTNTHAYTQHSSEGSDYFHCYRNWGIKNSSVSKAGPASDLQFFCWLEKLKWVLCGRPQRNSQAAKARKCNSISRSHEATRPVPAWFPINAEAQNAPFQHFPHHQRWKPHSPMAVKPWNCLKGRSSAPTHINEVLSPHVWWAEQLVQKHVLLCCMSAIKFSSRKFLLVPFGKKNPKLNSYLNVTGETTSQIRICSLPVFVSL